MNKTNSINIKLLHAAQRKKLMDALYTKKYPSGFEQLEHIAYEIISPKTILKFVNEELIHDRKEIKELVGQNLSTMSSGERKKAYLDYMLSLKPQTLVLDHFLDNLDGESRIIYHDKIMECSKYTDIINIYSRTEDHLSFIEGNLTYDDDQEQDTESGNKKALSSFTSVPPPPKEYLPYDGSLIEFHNVCVSYLDKPILNRISWQIDVGDFWHLYGPNGTGKTTLLSMINGDNPKAYGQDIWLFGQKKGSGETIWDIKQKVGYFTSNMTFQFKRLQHVKDMITSGFYDSIGLYVTPSDHHTLLANQWISFLGLDHLADVPFIKLSLCHQRIVMIARAMVKHPLLLILDEPSVDLDEESTRLVTALINKISQESATTIIYVSHRIEPGLSPTHEYQLVADQNGSIGIEKSVQ